MRESLDDVLKRQEEQAREALAEQRKRHEAEESESVREGKSDKPYNGWQFLKDIVEAGKAQQPQVVDAVKECDHTDKWKMYPGPDDTVRMCSGCGKSWILRDVLPTWQKIKEPVEE